MDIIAHRGILKIGKLRYDDDGMLYIGRKKHGPYMATLHYGRSLVVVRHAEKGNLHRFESLRWDLLLHIKDLAERRKKTIAELKKLRKPVGLFKGQWVQVTIKDGTIDKKPLEIDETNVLDAMVKFGTTESQQLVTKLLKLDELLEKYWIAAHRFNSILQGMFRELNPKQDWYGRYDALSVVINGRTYIVGHGHYPPDNPDLGWPSPLINHIDLDVARYSLAGA